MIEKGLWISFWITLAYWFGGALGCASQGQDQNYKVLDEEPRTYDHNGASARDESSALAQRYALLIGEDTADEVPPEAHAEPTPLPPAPVPANDVPPTPPEEMQVSVPAAGPAAVPAAAAPSEEVAADGLDRSHWPKIKTGPIDANTTHAPVYFRDKPLWRAEPTVTHILAEGQEDAALREAISHGQSDNLNDTNLWQLVVQPVF